MNRRPIVPDPRALKRTPLHGEHVEAGARLVPFAGWEMPVQYRGVVEEHLAVRTRAGLFDVSHMGEIEVRGPMALDLLQKVTCNNVAKLTDGRVQYSALTTPEGCFVDDILVHRIAADHYFLCVNAANAEKDLEWIRSHTSGDVEVLDRSDMYAELALQGPASATVLSRLAGEAPTLLKRYRFLIGKVDGVRAIIARTGYTGEDGFELYVPPHEAARLWRRILEVGRDVGLVPAGLGARDTLRLEAKMALYGNDIGETTTVLEADLGWLVTLDKGDFIGREALDRQKTRGIERRLVGFEMLDRGIARHGYPIVVAGREQGEVTSGSYAPYLRKNIGLTYMPSGSDAPGCTFEVMIRDRAAVARVVPTPFYKRGA
jgi:aminomethyltransferase